MGNMRQTQGLRRMNLGPDDPEQRPICAQVRFLGNARRWEEALATFAAVEQPGVHLRIAALRASTRSFLVEVSWRLFNEMPTRPLPAYNLMIGMLSRTGNLMQVEDLFQELQAQGLQPDAITFTSVMTAHGTGGDSQGALRVLGDMEARGLPLTEVEFGTAMGACGKNGDYRNALGLLARMEEGRVVPHVGHMTSLIISCAASKDEERATAAFADLRRRGLAPDVVAYTSMAVCLIGEDAFAKVKSLLDEMRAEGLQPHVFFYNELLRAANESRDIEGFQAVLREMEQTGIAPNNKTQQRIWVHQQVAGDVERQRASAEELQRGFAEEARGGAGGPGPGEEANVAAAAAAQRPLPEGWQQAIDPSTGRAYYWRASDPNGSVTWERPGGA